MPSSRRPSGSSTNQRSPATCRLGRAASINSRGEPLHPPEDRDVTHNESTLSQKLFPITVRHAVPQVPAHRQHDHRGWEAEPDEAGPRYGHGSGTARHQVSLPEPALGQRNRAPRTHLLTTAIVAVASAVRRVLVAHV